MTTAAESRQELERSLREFLAEGIGADAQIVPPGNYTGHAVIHAGAFLAFRGPGCAMNSFTARFTPGSTITATPTSCPLGGKISNIHIA